MGIYDREYYRREGPSFLHSITGIGRACKWLILINVIAYIAQFAVAGFDDWLDMRPGVTTAQPSIRDPRLLLQNPELVLELQDPRLTDEERQKKFEEILGRQNPSGVLQGQVWRLLTYAFLHSPSSVMHILFNMLFLWWFGHEMEQMYGSREFTIFYLFTAFLGGVAYFLWSLWRGNNIPCVGASGAITAVMVLFACHYPTRLIYVMLILPVPIWLFVLFQVAQDAFYFTSGRPTDVAVVVHLAGAAFGFVYYKRNWRLTPLWETVSRLRLPRRRPRLSVYHEEEPAPVRSAPSRPASTASTSGRVEVDEHLEAKVDAVLEKVARHGRDSLTESEKALLVRASEVYRRKRS